MLLFSAGGFHKQNRRFWPRKDLCNDYGNFRPARRYARCVFGCVFACVGVSWVEFYSKGFPWNVWVFVGACVWRARPAHVRTRVYTCVENVRLWMCFILCLCLCGFVYFISHLIIINIKEKKQENEKKNITIKALTSFDHKGAPRGTPQTSSAPTAAQLKAEIESLQKILFDSSSTPKQIDDANIKYVSLRSRNYALFFLLKKNN